MSVSKKLVTKKTYSDVKQSGPSPHCFRTTVGYKALEKISTMFSFHSHKVKMSAKLRADYAQVLHMPVLKETKDNRVQMGPGQPYTQPGDNTLHK